MLRRKGWSSSYQFPYLNRLWDRESSWNVHAANPYSGAYGIPQAVPGSKMESAGPDWQSSAGTQIRWGLDYIRDRTTPRAGPGSMKRRTAGTSRAALAIRLLVLAAWALRHARLFLAVTVTRPQRAGHRAARHIVVRTAPSGGHLTSPIGSKPTLAYRRSLAGLDDSR